MLELAQPSQSNQTTDEEMDRLRKAVETKDRFISTWAHEMNNLTNMISFAIDLYEKQKNGGDPTPINIMDYIKFASTLLKNVNSNIESFHKSGNEKLNIEEFDLATWLYHLQTGYNLVAAGRNVYTTCRIKGENRQLKTDKTRISQVITNLALNAIKFSNQNSVVSITAIASEANVKFTVEDNGIGIPGDRLDEIFQPYTRLAEGYPGSGLGLAICNKFITEMGGIIGVTSTEGAGTTFEVIIPQIE